MKPTLIPSRLVGPLALLVLFAAGCATTPPAGPRDPGAGASPAFRPAPADATAAHELSPAAASLVATADARLRAGEPDAAIAELERALRIEPRNPRIWQRLAVARLQQGDYAQAEALAGKANRLAGDNRAIQSVNWRLIAEARRQQNDQVGFEAAMRRAAELQGR